MVIKRPSSPSPRTTRTEQGRPVVRRAIRWQAVAFAMVLALIGGFFIWRSFANPLDNQSGAPDTAAVSSDFNQDGVTSLADMSRLLAVYGSQDAAVDLNGDGTVDAADLSALLARYQASQPSAAAPEVTPPAAATPTPPPAVVPVPTPAPAVKPSPTPSPPVDNTPPPAQEIASESECPNQSDAALPVDVQYAALQCMNAAARRYHGLKASYQDSPLMVSAAAKATDVANCEFSHTACGREVSYWFVQKGFKGKCYAENLGQNQKTVRQVFVQWMESPPHRADILNSIYVGVGIAVTPSSRGPIWVQHFGGCY